MARIIKHWQSYFLLAFSIFCSVQNINAQACDPLTPSFKFDLTGSPGGKWISPKTVRKGLCCGLDPNASPPIRCVEFIFTLDPESQGIKFDIASGAVPKGSMGYQINCGPYQQVGEILCLDGPGPWRLTFCKPGNNPNTYSITSIPKPSVSPPITVSDGCSGTLSAYGFDVSTIKWSSVPFNATHNSYLNCTEKCPTVTATMKVGAPPFVDYEVSGFPLGGCSILPVKKLTRVYFVNDKTATINPSNPAICFGANKTTLTVVGTGGAPPYRYLWSTGETTQAISVAAGTYSVEIFDNTSCPSAKTSITVRSFLVPITANAGPDVISCANNPSVVLNGAITAASGGIWSGGLGTYSPSNTSLKVTYVPTAAEISNGKVTHTLTTTGNGGCPAGSDAANHIITPAPVILASPASGCVDQLGIQLNANVSNATGGTWQTSGTGTFSPNANTLNAAYLPSTADKSNGSVNLTITSTGNGTCLPVQDSKILTITPPPTVNAGINQKICYDNTSVTLDGSVTIATGGIWSTSGTGTFSNPNSLTATYTPTTTEKNNGKVILTLTTTGNGSCNPVKDTMTLTILPRPIIYAGPGSLCSDEASIAISGIVQNANGGTWSTSGTGTFSPDNMMLNTNYIPSAADKLGGSIQLTLTSTGNNGCKPVSNTSTITVSPRPIVDAGADQTICSYTTQINVSGSVSIAAGATWSTRGTGTFASNTNLNTAYTLSASDQATSSFYLLLTSQSSGTCSPVIDSLKIIIQGAITNLPSKRNICFDENLIQLSATVSNAATANWATSNGTGTFPAGNSGTNVNYVPSLPDKNRGFVDFTVTTTALGVCTSYSAPVKILILPKPAAQAGPDVPVCKNINTISINGAIQNAGGGVWKTYGSGTFSNANILNPVYTFSNADKTGGKIFLVLTTAGNGTCNPAIDSLTATIFDAFPTAEAGSDTTICANVKSLKISGKITGAAGGVWKTSGSGTFSTLLSSLENVYTFSNTDINAPLQLTLTTTGNDCKTVADMLNVTFVNPAPVLFAGNDTSICSTVESINLKGIISGATSGVWATRGSGGFLPNKTNLNTSYYPSASDKATPFIYLVLNAAGVCNKTPDSLKLSFFDPTLAVDAGIDTSLCTTNSKLTLYGKMTNGTSSLWSSSGTGTFQPTAAALDAAYMPSQLDLDGGEVVLTLTGNSVCGSIKDDLTYVIKPGPVVNINGKDAICADIIEVALSATVADVRGIQWSTSGTGLITPDLNNLFIRYFPTAQDRALGKVTFTLASINNGGCPPSSETVTLVINPLPVVYAGPDQVVCENTSAQLSANVFPAALYRWFAKNPSTVISPNRKITVNIISDSSYFLLITDAKGCENLDSVDVKAIPTPILKIPDAIKCKGEIVTLDAIPTNPIAFPGLREKYSWSKDGFKLPDTTQTISVRLPGVYLGTYTYGTCPASASSSVAFISGPPTDMADQVKFCNESGSLILDAGAGYKYSWVNTTDSTRYLTVNIPKTYYVKVFNTAMCPSLDSIRVLDVCPPEIYVPSAFTPGVSGENQAFEIFGKNIDNFQLTIFNRWGEIIYYTQDRLKFWDGIYKGKPMPMGVYPWIIVYKGNAEDAESKMEKGSVTLLR